MSRYATWEELTSRYPDVAKATNGGNNGEASFIDPAENYIDTQFASRYTVPFCNTITFVPPFIKDLTIDVAYYRATGIRSKFAKNIKDDIDARIKLMNGGDGRIMTSSGTIAPTNTSGIFATNDQYSSSFGMDDPTMWHVSSVWQQDYEDNRQ